ncbi:MAG TPA: MFS transporter [Firmicutes bacterium]|nr:MFS transporter [Bacillota bacterium]
MAKLHKAVLNISVITALSILGDSLLYPVFPLYAEELGVPLVMVGVVLSINRWVRIVSNHVAARTFSVRSIYVPIILASVGAAISTGMYAFPIGIVGFLLARMLWGVCFSYFRMGSYLVVLQTSQSVLGWALGLAQAVLRLGSAFTALVGGYFIDLLGYRWTMLFMALLSALAFPLALLLKKQLPQSTHDPVEAVVTRGRKTSVSKNGLILSREFCYLGAFITHLIGSGLVTSSVALLLQETVGQGVRVGSWTLGIATISGFVFSSHWLSAIFLSSWSGALSDRYGRLVPFVGVTALQGSLLFVLAYVWHPWVSVAAAILFFVATNMQKVFLDAALGDTTDLEDRHTVTARYNSYQDLGAALGPLVGYGASIVSGFRVIYVVGAVMLLFVTVVPISNLFRSAEKSAL